MVSWIKRYFKVDERKSKVSIELLGGFITFLAMCYILPVNSSILSDMGMSSAGVFAATALLSGAITIFMGFYANYPVALSTGMGLNAFLTYTVALSLGYGWQECMILLTITGIIFFILSVTPLRVAIINAIPRPLQAIISAGLGAFICFVGLKNSGIVVSNSSTLVSLGNLASAPVWLALLGIAVSLFFLVKKTKHPLLNKMAIPLGVLFTAVVGLSLHYIGAAAGTDYFKDLPYFYGNWGAQGLQDVVFFGALSTQEGVSHDFGTLFTNVFKNPETYAIIFSLIFVNLFDTMATLVSVVKDSDLVDEKGRLISNRPIIADATGALLCGPLGTSTVTSFAESTVGVGIGARTGLASVACGTMFIIAAFAFPVFSIFTSPCVTAPALVVVGGLIFVDNLKEVDWKDLTLAFTAFITILGIVLTYSLTSGIGLGLLVYVIMMLASGRYKELNWILCVVATFFVVDFAVSAFLANAH